MVQGWTGAVLQTDGYVTMVPVGPGEHFQPGRPVELFEDQFVRTDGLWPPNYDVSPDGRFLMIDAADSYEASLILVQNWFEELKRLVPTE